jgi:CRP-like cAMP-binding protein
VVTTVRRQWQGVDVDLFRDLSDAHIARITGIGCPIDIPAGSPLGRAGDPADHVFVIMEGRVELWATSDAGPLSLRIAGPGESFPLAALVGSGALISSATAMTDVRLLAIPRSVLLELCATQPEVGMAVYRMVAGVLAGRYQQTLQRLTAGSRRALQDSGFWANV